jgi:hypothetical protein
MKLKDVSRELFLENGWAIPDGLINREDRDPLNFSREEWQQAKRANLNPKEIKRIFQDCWAQSDSRKAFEQALLSQGFVLARGDRRGYVALDYQGEVYSIARYTGVTTKAVRDRLGDPQGLKTVDQVKIQIADSMSEMLKQHLKQAENEAQQVSAAFEFTRIQLVDSQRTERQHLEQMQKKRWEAETNARAKRHSSGLKGVWHYLTGKYAKVRRQNELDALLALQRDRAEKDELIFKHIEQRQQLERRMKSERYIHELEIEELHQDIRQYSALKAGELSKLRKDFLKASEKKRRSPKTKRGRKWDRHFEPEI